MEQAPPDPEKLLQPEPLEPLGGPGAVLEAAVGEETEGTREDGSGVDTVRRGAAEASGLGPGLAGRTGLPWLSLVGAVPRPEDDPELSGNGLTGAAYRRAAWARSRTSVVAWPAVSVGASPGVWPWRVWLLFPAGRGGRWEADTPRVRGECAQ